ncbi:MAG: hypothetical protein IPH90_03160 [Thermomonas sp.]|nr:hypothetical protein [Thermomonas sp.]
MTHASGFYAGAWASNVDFTAAGEDDDGIDIELDPYIGWSGALGENAELDVSLTYVSYPGHLDGYDYAYTELEGVLTFADHFHVGLAYSPDIFNLGGHGIYGNAGVELPLGESGFDLKAQVKALRPQRCGRRQLQRLPGRSWPQLRPLRADLRTPTPPATARH